jgi:hypothetical protein
VKGNKEVMNHWQTDTIKLWKEKKLDIDLMHYLSIYFKIDEKDEHVGLDNLGLGLFKMFIYFHGQGKASIHAIYDFLNKELDEKEAFRRMLTFKAQFSQILFKNAKEKFQYSKFTPDGLFEGSKSGDFEKTYDYYGYYGINDEKEINKELYPFFCQEDELDTNSESFFTKYVIYTFVLGFQEYYDRTSPRMHFPDKFLSSSNFIGRSNYMNIINSEKFIAALDSNGISLNRVMSVILILGLEEETLNLDTLPLEEFHYLAKVLCKVMYPPFSSHLLWTDTSERHFLKEHYPDKYFAHFRSFLLKLKSIPHKTSIESGRVAYSTEETNKVGDINEVKAQGTLYKRYQKADEILKRRDVRQCVQELDKMSCSELAEILSRFES